MSTFMNLECKEQLYDFKTLDNDAIINTLKCSICWDIFRQPMQTTCNHYFCKECVETYVKIKNFFSKETEFCCPLCRSVDDLDEIVPNTMLQNIVDSLQLECQVKNMNGDICGDRMKMVDVQKHLDIDCRFVTMKCVNQPNGCEMLLQRQFMLHHHEKECEYNLKRLYVECEDCGLKIHRRYVNKHKESEQYKKKLRKRKRK